MTNLLFQRNIFHENDDEHINIIKKYFHVHEVDPDHITEYDSEGQHFSYRTSIAVAKRNKVFEKFTNALEWAGKLRKEIVCEHFQFQTLDYIVEYFYDWFVDTYRVDYCKLFVRPVAGDKVFAGNVFTQETLKNEYDFLMQRNVDPHTLCMVNFVYPIQKEYRLIFIDNNYISGSQYMDCGELSVSPEVPKQVVEYGKQIYTKYNLPPWVVLDIGMVHGVPRVIELNQIETTSFYAADLDRIYKDWADYYKN